MDAFQWWGWAWLWGAAVTAPAWLARACTAFTLGPCGRLSVPKPESGPVQFELVKCLHPHWFRANLAQRKWASVHTEAWEGEHTHQTRDGNSKREILCLLHWNGLWRPCPQNGPSSCQQKTKVTKDSVCVKFFYLKPETLTVSESLNLSVEIMNINTLLKQDIWLTAGDTGHLRVRLSRHPV